MKFVPEAAVYHSHPQTWSEYLRKKYKFAFWRVVALRSNPQKALKDSHTPQLMKLQLLFIPALLVAAGIGFLERLPLVFVASVILVFFVSTVPFVLRVLKKDSSVALASPLLLAARSGAQLLGVAAGLSYSANKPVKVVTKSSAA